MHGARTTLALVATLLGAWQLQTIPQRIKQRHTVVDPEPLRAPVYFKSDFC
jgi:hypothetical protein